jgi:hypothetical protein
MIIQIPQEIREKIQGVALGELNKIIDTARANSDNIMLTWSMYYKAENLNLSGFPAAIRDAFRIYEALNKYARLAR